MKEIPMITLSLAKKLISSQFPEYTHLPVTSVEEQGHDNRTYRLGGEMLIRLPAAESYALKVPKEQELLPKLAPYITVQIPAPLKMGVPSEDYPFPFSIYKWLEGKSLNLLSPDEETIEQLAFDLAQFLKELEAITGVEGPEPGQHNWWRGDHLSVYDKGARDQIASLRDLIESDKALALWERACATYWPNPPVWVHGDVAVGNMLMDQGRLSAMIDFGGIALGDPACDLVVAWTYFSGKARTTFIQEMNLDPDTWLRARGWALWKAAYELCQLEDKRCDKALEQQRIIADLLSFS